MEKTFKLVFNSMLLVFLFGLIALPFASMGVMGIKQSSVQPQTEVLSIEDVKETTESESPEVPELIHFEEINY